MPFFRTALAYGLPAGPINHDSIYALVSAAIHQQHFLVGDGLTLEWTFDPNEQAYWELFRGRVLDQSQTRLQRTFQTWAVRTVSDQGGVVEPLIAVRMDAQTGELFVTRAVQCHAWETFDEQGAILSRETTKWQRELVGVIRPAEFASMAALFDELVANLHFAVVGVSRLPLTSVELPLPSFTFGQLHYCYTSCRKAQDSLTSAMERFAEDGMGIVEQARLIESAIRATPSDGMAELAQGIERLRRSYPQQDVSWTRLFAIMFNNVALSPYNDFVSRVLKLVHECRVRGVFSLGDQVDFLAGVLRLICRHLTAFDLFRFHHRGANYPDALLIEEFLGALLDCIESAPELMHDSPNDASEERRKKRLRRRAFRQAWIVRMQYHDLPVPFAPTSPGENLRVLPAPHHRVPEEQLLQPLTRPRLLFHDYLSLSDLMPLAKTALESSLNDLKQASERVELGMAYFLDRPLGMPKAIGEPDRTPLLSYETFNCRVAIERCSRLGDWFGNLIDPATRDAAIEGLADHGLLTGVPATPYGLPRRVGVVSLEDANIATPDSVFLRCSRSSIRDFAANYDLESLAAATGFGLGILDRCLLIRNATDPGTLTVFDNRMNRRLNLRVDASRGFATRGGVELPIEPLRVEQMLSESGEAVSIGPVSISPKWEGLVPSN